MTDRHDALPLSAIRFGMRLRHLDHPEYGLCVVIHLGVDNRFFVFVSDQGSTKEHYGHHGLSRFVLDASEQPIPPAEEAPVAQPEALDVETEIALREYLWINHGHHGIYGDDGEMQCGRCAPCWDYRRAPLAEVVRAAIKGRAEVNLQQLASVPVAPPAQEK